MWRRVQLDVMIDHPPGRVFPWLADPARWGEWSPAVVERRQVDDGPPIVGSRWAAVDRIGPFRIRFTDELVALEPDALVVWDSTSPWNSRVEYQLLPQADGTRILAHYEGDVAGWLRLVALLPTAMLARILQRDFHGLQRCLAGENLDAAQANLEAPSESAG